MLLERLVTSTHLTSVAQDFVADLWLPPVFSCILDAKYVAKAYASILESKEPTCERRRLALRCARALEAVRRADVTSPKYVVFDGICSNINCELVGFVIDPRQPQVRDEVLYASVR